MKNKPVAASPAIPKEPLVNIRNVLKLMGMKEVATNVFSLPPKNKS